MSGTRAMKRDSALPALGISLVVALFAMCVLMLGHAASSHAEHHAGTATVAAVSAAAPVAAPAVAAPATAAHDGVGHDGADHEAILAATAVIAAVTPDAISSSSSGMHGDAHGAMMLMVCAMALLTVAVLLLAPRVLRGLRPRFAPLRARALIAAARLPKPRPPSLIVLSISRT